MYIYVIYIHKNKYVIRCFPKKNCCPLSPIIFFSRYGIGHRHYFSIQYSILTLKLEDLKFIMIHTSYKSYQPSELNQDPTPAPVTTGDVT